LAAYCALVAPQQDTSGVPDEVATAVAAFLQARLSDAERWAGVSVKDSADWREQLALVREWEEARTRGRQVTADNLALTMLATAARYRTHRNYDSGWDTWQPFGDLRPPSKT